VEILAAAICLILAVYDRESKSPHLLCLLLRWREGVGTLDLCSTLLKGPLVRVLSTGIIIMMAMTALCGTRIRYTRLLVLLIGNNLVDGVEEDGDSSGRRFHGVMNLVYYTCYRLGVRSFRWIQGFNGDDFSSRALVLRSTCRKTSRLSSIKLDRLW
jgi:hypothetical protein